MMMMLRSQIDKPSNDSRKDAVSNCFCKLGIEIISDCFVLFYSQKFLHNFSMCFVPCFSDFYVH